MSKIIQILYGDDDLKAFWGSLQGRDALPYQSLEKLDNWIYPISFLFVLSIGIWSLRRMENNSYLLPLFTIVFIMGNNILCAAFSGLFDRYQARVSWLLIFAVLLMAGEFYRKYKETASKTNAVI